MTRRIDMTGQHYGRLTVMGYAGRDEHNGNALWRCECECGNTIVTDGYRLRHGSTTSCGCWRREVSVVNAMKNPAFVANIGAHDGFGVMDGVNLQASLIPRRNNRSGVPGVSFDKTSKRWVARLMLRGKYLLNQMFDSYSDAVAARRQAEQMYLTPEVQRQLNNAPDSRSLKRVLAAVQARQD
ncbi:alcohol dehydrogenase [Lacticaseibacillus jixiensis]|uniref:alcohol dehydrogenase n=1 Tax=Lacticaseibacillus jixiensis TaxID=3231926 RepID=UPI0036F252F8